MNFRLMTLELKRGSNFPFAQRAMNSGRIGSYYAHGVKCYPKFYR
jgi:hypothetical protein